MPTLTRTATWALLFLLGIVVFNNWAKGTLGVWARAKFLNQAHGSAAPSLGLAGGGATAAPRPIGEGQVDAFGLYSAGQLASLAKANGLTGEAAVTAVAVALAESGGNPAAVSSTGDYGLWQINAKAHPTYTTAQLLDPSTNARAMAAISSGGRSWSAWTTYTSGKYKGFLATARAAV